MTLNLFTMCNMFTVPNKNNYFWIISQTFVSLKLRPNQNIQIHGIMNSDHANWTTQLNFMRNLQRNHNAATSYCGMQITAAPGKIQWFLTGILYAFNNRSMTFASWKWSMRHDFDNVWDPWTMSPIYRYLALCIKVWGELTPRDGRTNAL